LALARQFGAELIALHVADDDRPDEMMATECRTAEAAIHQELAAARVNGLEPVIVTRTGDPFKIIVDEADRVEADLIVMGAHRKRLLADVFTGTTVERVIRLGSRPVLMVNRDGEKPYSRVLAAVDLSETSAHAMRTARAIGLLDPAHAAAVHGFLPLAEGMMYYANVGQSQIDQHIAVSASEARAALGGFLRKNGLADLAEVLLIEKGGPYEAIEMGVQSFRPDLLVVGTRGQTGVKRVLLGSVADQVLRRSDTDVLAVPPQRGR